MISAGDSMSNGNSFECSDAPSARDTELPVFKWMRAIPRDL